MADLTVTRTTHEHLVHEDSRGTACPALILVNQTPGTIRRTPGYDIDPSGTGGTWLLAAERDARGGVTRR